MDIVIDWFRDKVIGNDLTSILKRFSNIKHKRI